MNHQNCLVLNADYTPMGIIDWKKAMVWSFRYTHEHNPSIEIIEWHNQDKVISSTGPVKIHSVVRAIKYFRMYNKAVNFCRKNVFIRDDFTCQYCHSQFPVGKLTYDHVIPKSKWREHSSPTSWTNIVTCCIKCNLRKSDKTPEQANMPLKRQPIAPQKSFKYLPLAYQLHTILKELPEQWVTYIGDVRK